MRERILLVAVVAAGFVLSGCDGCRAAPSGDATASTAAPPASGSASAGTDALAPSREKVEAALNPNKLPAYSGATGSVEGTVFVEGDAPPPVTGQDFSKCPAAATMYGALFRAGAAVTGAGGVPRRPAADAVVAVTGYSGFYVPSRSQPTRVVFRDCVLPSRTFALTYGEPLEVANGSKLLFAPALAEVRSAAMMVAPPEEHGDPVKLYAPKPGRFTLVDTVRSLPYLQADVYALLQPLHAVTDAGGHYRVDGVPVGKLSVGARLPSIHQETTADVEILEGVVQHVDLVLQYRTAKPMESDAGAPVDAGRRVHIH